MCFSHVSQWLKCLCSAMLQSGWVWGLRWALRALPAPGFCACGGGSPCCVCLLEKGQGSCVPAVPMGCTPTLTPSPLAAFQGCPCRCHPANDGPESLGTAFPELQQHQPVPGVFSSCPVPGSCPDLVKALLLDLWNTEGSDPCLTLGFSLFWSGNSTLTPAKETGRISPGKGQGRVCLAWS